VPVSVCVCVRESPIGLTLCKVHLEQGTLSVRVSAYERVHAQELVNLRVHKVSTVLGGSA